jgi:hypothetical protein
MAWWWGLVKVLMSFRFDSALSENFRKLSQANKMPMTQALERFMHCCVDFGALVFPDKGVEGFEAEARVLVDWLGKGKRLYRDASGREINISGRLVWLLSKVSDANLRRGMEEALRASVSEKQG